MEKSVTTITTTPLQKIALCCSGGGYRAASFHLGSMSYLNRLPYGSGTLLENVKMISTVSGGTITGIVYALCKQKNKSFEEIYGFLLGELEKHDLVKMGIEKLNPGGQWTDTHKRKNLINAFAELYDQHLTGGETLSVFDKMNSHLEAVVFNSTEFNNAINFRFRNRSSGLIGNKYNQVNKAAAGAIKLGDIMAASSCFPGGFEPIMWPADFAHEKTDFENMKPAGLMDGGIYDNQGIESVILFDNNKKGYFDLVIVSDVTSPYMKPFAAAKEENKGGWQSMTVKKFGQKVKSVNNWINFSMLAIVALFALLPSIWKYPNHWLTGLSIGIAASVLLLWLGKILAVSALKKLLIRTKTRIEQYINSNRLDFYYDRVSKLKIEEVPIYRILPLLLDRFNSLISLLMNVFLKVVRRLNYDKMYEDEKWKYRRISNLIYELTEKDYRQDEQTPTRPTDETGQSPEAKTHVQTLAGTYEAAIGQKIKEVAELATSFGTTLWFTDENKLDNMLNTLVATGQFTMCYNLVDYIEKLQANADSGYHDLDEASKKILETVRTQCIADWKQFKEDPLFLVKQMEQYVKK